jgi:hypothetical protein
MVEAIIESPNIFSKLRRQRKKWPKNRNWKPSKRMTKTISKPETKKHLPDTQKNRNTKKGIVQ